MVDHPRTLTPADRWRLFGGLAVQPVIAAVLTFVTYTRFFPERIPPVNYSPDQVATAISLYFGMASLCITFLCVLPTVVWLARRRSVGLMDSIFFGLLFSNAPVALTMLSGGGGLRMHAFASLIGLLGATAFWFISIRGDDFGRKFAAV